MSVVSRQISGMSFMGCRVETSGMEPAMEETAKELASKWNAEASFDVKAKYMIDGMAKVHGCDWACIVESY